MQALSSGHAHVEMRLEGVSAKKRRRCSATSSTSDLWAPRQTQGGPSRCFACCSSCPVRCREKPPQQQEFASWDASVAAKATTVPTTGSSLDNLSSALARSVDGPQELNHHSQLTVLPNYRWKSSSLYESVVVGWNLQEVRSSRWRTRSYEFKPA